jgi:hypothetical protein
MSKAEKFLRDKSLSFYAENPNYYKGLVLKREDVIEIMEEYAQSKPETVEAKEEDIHVVAGENGYFYCTSTKKCCSEQCNDCKDLGKKA